MDVFAEGEYRRESFLSGPPQWLDGFSDSDESYLREWHGPDGGMLPTNLRVVSGRLEAKSRFTAHEIPFIREYASGTIKITIPAVSMLGYWGFNAGITDKFYESHAAMQSDLAAVIKAEAAAAIADGVQYVQFDAPNYGTRFCGESVRFTMAGNPLDPDRFRNGRRFL